MTKMPTFVACETLAIGVVGGRLVEEGVPLLRGVGACAGGPLRLRGLAALRGRLRDLDGLELRVEERATLREGGAIFTSEDAHPIEAQGERVDERVPALHAEVEVGAGDPPRRPHVADELPRLDVLPRIEARREARQVAVDAREVVRVGDLDHVATRAAIARTPHRSRRGRVDGSAGASGEVDAVVRHDDVEDRMHPVRVEARRDAGERGGRSPRALVGLLALGVVIAAA
jgi:hypothetical protein